MTALSGCGAELSLSKLMQIAKAVPVPRDMHYVDAISGVSDDTTTGVSTNVVHLEFKSDVTCTEAKTLWVQALRDRHRKFTTNYHQDLGALYLSLTDTPAKVYIVLGSGGLPRSCLGTDGVDVSAWAR